MGKNGARMTGVGSLIEALDDIEDRWTRDVRYVVGTSQEYAVFVEYGTSSQAAQPYLRPAAEQTKRELDTIAGQANDINEFVELAALNVERISKEVVPVDTGALKSSIRTEKL